MTSIFNASAWFADKATEEDFEQFYHAELPRVYNFFRYRFGDGLLAEDLTSETFEKAWKYRDKYKRNLSALSTWIFTIARNIAIDHYRKKDNETPLTESMNFPSNEITMDDLAQRQTDYARLSTLLFQLDNREHELVALKYGAGLTNRAIASLTGLGESNVAVILHRVVEKLRNEWEKP